MLSDAANCLLNSFFFSLYFTHLKDNDFWKPSLAIERIRVYPAKVVRVLRSIVCSWLLVSLEICNNEKQTVTRPVM